MEWLEAMIDTASMFDAEFCPDPIPAGYDAALVYAGGSSAAHPWEPAELALVAHLPRLPTWVPTAGTDDPQAAAEAFLAWLSDHGVPAVNPVTGAHQLVMWDAETGQDMNHRWFKQACDHMSSAGYFNLVYGSISTLFALPARSGYMVANPTGAPHMYLRPEVAGTQYTFNKPTQGGKIDQWALVREIVHQFWQPAR